MCPWLSCTHTNDSKFPNPNFCDGPNCCDAYLEEWGNFEIRAVARQMSKPVRERETKCITCCYHKGSVFFLRAVLSHMNGLLEVVRNLLHGWKFPDSAEGERGEYRWRVTICDTGSMEITRKCRGLIYTGRRNLHIGWKYCCRRESAQTSMIAHKQLLLHFVIVGKGGVLGRNTSHLEIAVPEKWDRSTRTSRAARTYLLS